MNSVLQHIWKHKPREVICAKINRTILRDKDFLTLRDGEYINDKVTILNLCSLFHNLVEIIEK